MTPFAMALTPSLARLSLVARTGTGKERWPKAARGRGEAKKELPAEQLPAELWTLIVALSADDDDDICKKIKELCNKKYLAKWLGSCKDDSFFFEEINKHLGWYGDLPDWAAVEAHYQEGRAWATRINRGFNAFENAAAYFSHVCAERRALRDAHARRRHRKTYAMEVRRRLLDSHLHEFDDDGPRHGWYHPYVTSLAKYAVRFNWTVLEEVPGSMDEIKEFDMYPINGYVEVALAAVRTDGAALQFVPGSIDDSTGEQRYACIDGYVEIAMNALLQNGMALAYVPGSRVVNPEIGADVPFLKPEAWYAKLATFAMQTTPDSLKFVPHTLDQYTAIAEVAVYTEPSTFKYVPTDLPDYVTLAEVAITIKPNVIELVPRNHPNYAYLAALSS